MGLAPEGRAARLDDGQLDLGRLGRDAPRHLDPAIGTQGPGRVRPGRPRLAPALFVTPGTDNPHRCGWVDVACSGLRPALSLPLRSQGGSQCQERCRASYEAASSGAAISPRPRRHCVDRLLVVGLGFGNCPCHRGGDLADCRDHAGRGRGSGHRRSRHHPRGCLSATR